MISVPPGIRVMVATVPVDFRKGMDGLAVLVQEALRRDPFSGDIFVFRAKRLDRVKILAWDGTGLMLVHKRLETGRFPLAADPGRSDDADLGPTRHAAGRTGLGAGQADDDKVSCPGGLIAAVFPSAV